MTQLDYDLDNYLESLDREYECTECGTPIKSQGVCSSDCFNASNL
jgi:hypothetical protein